MGDVLADILGIYRIAVFAWIIMSWVRISTTHPLARLQLWLDRIIYPVILPLRRVVPPLRLGGAMLDLSPIVLLIAITIVQSLLRSL
ncbi:MAG TPA: YggT family protein [Acidimicrobiia bacterium]|nr:YggT family protein [Acidimicrobiia bacterium]